jgi:NAD(P)-dependent dehydrogenase (short-subunit alcohol dehydrogenase family)
MKDFRAKVAVITGAGGARSIGRATAAAFAREGCRVVLADVDEEALQSTVQDLLAFGYDAVGVPTDVGCLASMKNLADTAFETFGQVDIAFLNAGVSGGGNLFDDEMDSWQRIYNINVFGVVHGIKAFAERMTAQDTEGHILGTTSGSGVNGVMYQTPPYTSSKAAVCSVMECLYGQLRDMGSQVRAHVVMPPLTNTNLAGRPGLMTYVRDGLEAGGVPTVLAEPEQVGETVIEAIRDDRFWVYHDREADARLTHGQFAEAIDWQNEMVRQRTESLIERTDPDNHLWGMKR